MRAASILTTTAAVLLGTSVAQSGQPGYFTNYSTVSGNDLSFGKNYAVLNLDMINGLVAGVADSAVGQQWIASTAQWIQAVHAKQPRPLEIFTRIYFSKPWRPEIGPHTPFAASASGLGNATADSPQSQIYPAFEPDAQDLVLQKSRYYGGFGNELQEVLHAQQVDTVVLSGIRSSGVIITTAAQLFDLDYTVYVIADNAIESPDTSSTQDSAQAIDQAIKQGILPKFPLGVITLKQALAALAKSG